MQSHTGAPATNAGPGLGSGWRGTPLRGVDAAPGVVIRVGRSNAELDDGVGCRGPSAQNLGTQHACPRRGTAPGIQ
ncbi:hypothetical protein NDU88_000424 [Pleurodeles waltl]|uniref:Uncharacterized protein n=1 Tax=Pleurodeles waltl TaxID=8319 RepID=A0AAV7S9H6_PLEWA|nr:hypothetical protein NDU88_000424 [Pleurodeles waltl]